MNYQNKLLELINSLDYRPKLFLHSCCGPCSTTVITMLKEYFDITVFYYNPNIEPREEYEKRKSEQIRLIKELDSEFVKFLDCDYANEEFRSVAKGLEEEKEGGARCSVCFKLRLEKTALKAKKLGFEYFGTTLTVSPYKNSKVINAIGAMLEDNFGVKYLYSDFKKMMDIKKVLN